MGKGKAKRNKKKGSKPSNQSSGSANFSSEVSTTSEHSKKNKSIDSIDQLSEIRSSLENISLDSSKDDDLALSAANIGDEQHNEIASATNIKSEQHDEIASATNIESEQHDEITSAANIKKEKYEDKFSDANIDTNIREEGSKNRKYNLISGQTGRESSQRMNSINDRGQGSKFRKNSRNQSGGDNFQKITDNRNNNTMEQGNKNRNNIVSRNEIGRREENFCQGNKKDTSYRNSHQGAHQNSKLSEPKGSLNEEHEPITSNDEHLGDSDEPRSTFQRQFLYSTTVSGTGNQFNINAEEFVPINKNENPLKMQVGRPPPTPSCITGNSADTARVKETHLQEETRLINLPAVSYTPVPVTENWDDENVDNADNEFSASVTSHKYASNNEYCNNIVQKTGTINNYDDNELGYKNNKQHDDNWRNWQTPVNTTKTRHSLDNSRSQGERQGKGSRWSDPRLDRQKYPVDVSKEKWDQEYEMFMDEFRRRVAINYVKVVEKEQDLFEMPKEYSLAHCVAEDLRMGSGIAVNFKRDFQELGTLLGQRQKQGGLAILEQQTASGIRNIYYLITKKQSNGKPTYETFWKSVTKMRDHIREKRVKKLAIPRLGCGLDRLEWSRVKHMIEFLFRKDDIEIVVCNFQQAEDSPQKGARTCKVVHVAKPIDEIESETTIIYFSTVDGYESKEMQQLSKKFDFLSEFKRAPKRLGDLVKYEDKKRYYILYGCIVRKSIKDPFDYKIFAECIKNINKNNKKDQYEYVGLPALKPEDDDDLINEKVITIMKNYLRNVDIYVCHDKDLEYLISSSFRD